MPNNNLPAFPYGAVYFRKSNPPREDWERDYRVAAEDGMNIFRHWFLWSAIEIAPGEYDWEEYDRHLDLAAENGMKTIIAEMITSAPEWVFRKYDHARYETQDGRKVHSSMGASSATGGFPGLCLDNEDFKVVAEGFLREMATHYKGHPALGGYDIWNECNYAHNVCYCPATIAKFQEWLRDKYGDLRTMSRSWGRYGFASWEDVTPPRAMTPAPDSLDWLQFRIDNAYRLMRWRAELIRSIDAETSMTAHGVVGSLSIMAPGGADDWRAASEVEIYGYTWGSSRHGDEPWKQLHAVDLVRAASRGKPFWHAETYAGPLWMQSQVVNRPRDEGRIASPEDIRYWDLTSFMAGATGMLYLRWRPLLDGPLFGAFGAYGMDGSRTPRSEMVSAIGKWATAAEQEQLWQSRPIKGEVGIIYVPETQIFSYAQQGLTATVPSRTPGVTSNYTEAVRGVYRGFFENNIQPDWVHVDNISEYDLLYLPYPIMLNQATAEELRQWVADGGTLISEGCPAYFGDRGHVGTVQPNFGLDEVFGARESYVEFTPDLLVDLRVIVSGTPVWGGIFMQAYEPTTGTASGWYEDGQVAVVDHSYGKGRTRLIGTMAGAGHSAHAPNGSSRFFADLLPFAGKTQHIRSSDPQITARIHAGEGGTYLWVANPTRQPRPVRLELAEAWRNAAGSRTLWGAQAELQGRTVTLTVPARDITVLAIA